MRRLLRALFSALALPCKVGAKVGKGAVAEVTAPFFCFPFYNMPDWKAGRGVEVNVNVGSSWVPKLSSMRGRMICSFMTTSASSLLMASS
jgi:hypothetical protein